MKNIINNLGATQLASVGLSCLLAVGCSKSKQDAEPKTSTSEAAPVAAAQAPAPAPAPAPAAQLDEVQLGALLTSDMKRVDDTHFEVTRKLFDAMLSNQAVMSGSAKFVPSIQDNVAGGFRVYSVKPGTAFDALGLKSGDIINAVNGRSLASAEDALSVYVAIKQESKFAVELTRGGKPLTLHYTVQ